MALDKAPKVFRPFQYQWAYDAWLKQQQIHWLPEEVPLGNDVANWGHDLTPSEKNVLTHIFRFFTQSDIEVQDNYMERLGRVFKPTEVKMMLAAFANMETVHIAAYALLLDTIGMPETEFGAFLEYEEMRNKHEFLGTFNVDNAYETAKTLAGFGAFTEGLQLFASFAILMHFPRMNKMKGMGQIVSWSIRDESLHCDNIIKLYHTWLDEHPEIDRPKLNADLLVMLKHIVDMEHKFIDLAFELGDIEGLAAKDVKDYIVYVARLRARQLNIEDPFPDGPSKTPLPWLDQLTGGVEHANFFEARATEYSKAATKGDYSDIEW